MVLIRRDADGFFVLNQLVSFDTPIEAGCVDIRDIL